MVAASESSQSLVSEPRKRGKRRSQAEKVGRLKYIIQLEKRILRQLHILHLAQRYMIEGLDIAGYLQFDKSFIEKVCCRDEVDLEILDQLYSAGVAGALPSDLAADLRRYEISRWMVTYRIKRMNRRLQEQIAKDASEKHGHKWALTEFAYKAWQQTYEELKE